MLHRIRQALERLAPELETHNQRLTLENHSVDLELHDQAARLPALAAARPYLQGLL